MELSPTFAPMDELSFPNNNSNKRTNDVLAALERGIVGDEVLENRLTRLRVNELKNILRELRQRLGGRKTDLIARIVAHHLHDPVTVESAVEAQEHGSLTVNSGQTSSLILPPKFTFIDEVAIEGLKHLDPFSAFMMTIIEPLLVEHYTALQFIVDDDTHQKLMAPAYQENGQQFVIQVRCIDVNGTKTKQAWPSSTAISVNGKQLMVVQSRPNGTAKPNKSIYERPADISKYVLRGANSLTCGALLSKTDAYVMGVYLVRKVSPTEHLQRISASQFVDFVSGQKRLDAMFGGDDDDDEVAATSMTVKLKCPLGLVPIDKPGRGRECPHVQCFDINTFLTFQSNAKNASWKCPVCNKPIDINSLVMDQWFLRLLEETRRSPSLDRVEVYPHGEWAPLGGKRSVLTEQPTKQEPTSDPNGVAAVKTENGEAPETNIATTTTIDDATLKPESSASSNPNAAIDLADESEDESEDEEERRMFERMKNRATRPSQQQQQQQQQQHPPEQQQSSHPFTMNNPSNGVCLFPSYVSGVPHQLYPGTLMNMNPNLHPFTISPNRALSGRIGESNNTSPQLQPVAQMAPPPQHQPQPPPQHQPQPPPPPARTSTGMSRDDAINILSDSDDDTFSSW